MCVIYGWFPIQVHLDKTQVRIKYVYQGCSSLYLDFLIKKMLILFWARLSNDKESPTGLESHLLKETCFDYLKIRIII